MIDFLVSLWLILLGIPVLVFFIECLVGLFDGEAEEAVAVPEHIRTAILIPAHNEEDVITRTLEALTKQTSEGDQVVVIADNCSDKTAKLARSHGVDVIERQSDNEKGKGYALDFGIQFLREHDTQPDIVIIVDADCILGEGALGQLKAQVFETQKPAQACYLMLRGDIDRIAIKVSEFAFKVKNKIRLRGLSRLGFPVPLTGTGMAFPWPVLAEAQLATGDIVEDMRLGVELAESGLGAQYCDQAYVYSYFPTSEHGEKTQRERWEHGHINTLRRYVPRLFNAAFSRKNFSALGMMFDLLVPPLSLLVMLVGAVFMTLVVYALFTGAWHHTQLAGEYLVLILCTVLFTWAKHGRSILTPKELLHIPVYIVSKLSIYLAYMIRKQTTWIRTDRK